LALFMMVSQPSKLPVVVLIVPFVLLLGAFYSLWTLISLIRRRYLSRKGDEARPHRRLGLAVSLSATLLLVLQSLGQLTLRDVLTVAAIIILGYLYVSRSPFDVPHR
jgi:hypothetical protein